jgi:hypothetical protein
MPRRDISPGASPGGAPGEKGPAFWREVKPGDFISLSDPEAFEASLASGGGASVDYRVGQVRSFALRGREDFAPQARGARPLRVAPRETRGEYRFIELTPAAAPEGSGSLYLAAVDRPDKGSGIEGFELRLYYIPAGLDPGSRDDFIDRGDAWLFLPPPDPEDFISSELEYAPYPDVPEIEEPGSGERRKLVFARVGPSCLYAEAEDTEAPAIIAEYCAERGAAGFPEGGKEPANPLMLVLEEGWMRKDGSEPEEGGYLTVMLGKVMRTMDVEHWPA